MTAYSLALALAAFAMVLMALGLRAYSKRRMAALDMAGEVVYWDATQSGETFESTEHGLTGRPDYILKSGKELIPVERKSRMLSGRAPHSGEILQLAAYCLLVEERFGRTVLRGQLQYPDRTLDIAFDDHLRRQLTAALHAMHEAITKDDVARSHTSPARCRACGFRDICTQALG
jgi:CRISPR-associated exonuclease Cas4